MIISENTQKEINEIRESYRSIAIRGSTLYFVVGEMKKNDCMN